MNIVFNINFHTVWGQSLCIIGSVPELGSWKPGLAKEMTYASDGNWQLCLDLDSDADLIEYRYFIRTKDKPLFEEWERNHKVRLDKMFERLVLYDYWQLRPVNLAFYSSAFTQAVFAHLPDNNARMPAACRKKLIIKIVSPQVEKDQVVMITGNQPCLGCWQPEKGLPLHSDTFPEWYVELDASEITYPLEYKFLISDSTTNKPLYWETNANRTLNLPEQTEGDETIVSGLVFQGNQSLWHGSGTVIPLFSLRSEHSFGVGDMGDLRLLVDWAEHTGQKVIQLLPINDTTMSHTWRDSYPYSAISIYALHPIYIDLSQLGPLKDNEAARFFAEKSAELNSKDFVDYEAVLRYKKEYSLSWFKQEGESRLLDSPDFLCFFEANRRWLVPYAAYCYLRDRFRTSDFTKWGAYSVYNEVGISRLCQEGEAYPSICFSYFMQYELDKQLRSVSAYARKKGIILKGDLPIGVNRTSVEVWTEPHYFNTSGQAGAPPDDFSILGQNWRFPTYKWDVMEADGFDWWKRRLRKMEDYFDAFRIDHILGFFRIWEIPEEYVQGLCGHFNPALPFTRYEIESYGFSFDEVRFTVPYIDERHLPGLFGEISSQVADTYLMRSSSRHFILKPFCDTQKKIESLFADKMDAISSRIRDGLYHIANEVLFMKDPICREKYHPRISASQSFVYGELSASDRYAFDQLYWDFFYHRHNDFWKARAFDRLTPLINNTKMLVCGEDLGMIPASVPDVMSKLQILSLEVERMPKAPNREFEDLRGLPYDSVCTTSTHDMSPIRNWWKEDREKSRRYYASVLMGEGEAPDDCTTDVVRAIISGHLLSPSMLAIFPLQDWLAVEDSTRRTDMEAERINVPSDPDHYWCFRMHLTLEALLSSELLNERIRGMLKESGRL